MGKQSFNALIKQPDLPVLVDFHATWCGPCQTLAPIVEDFAKEMSGKVKVIKVDVDKNQGVSSKYNIRGVPTLILFKNGEIVWRKSGLMTKRDLTAQVNGHL